jgi:hypothetical protein
VAKLRYQLDSNGKYGIWRNVPGELLFIHEIEKHGYFSSLAHSAFDQ